MAVYGIGAMYGGTEDKLDNFLANDVACVGFDPAQAPGIHRQMTAIKAGDLIFIKSYVPQSGLHIKAVGIVTDPEFRRMPPGLGWGIGVRWVSQARIDIGPVRDFCDHLRRGSLYEELNPDVVARVIDELIPNRPN